MKCQTIHPTPFVCLYDFNFTRNINLKKNTSILPVILSWKKILQIELLPDTPFGLLLRFSITFRFRFFEDALRTGRLIRFIRLSFVSTYFCKNVGNRFRRVGVIVRRRDAGDEAVESRQNVFLRRTFLRRCRRRHFDDVTLVSSNFYFDWKFIVTTSKETTLFFKISFRKKK